MHTEVLFSVSSITKANFFLCHSKSVKGKQPFHSIWVNNLSISFLLQNKKRKKGIKLLSSFQKKKTIFKAPWLLSFDASYEWNGEVYGPVFTDPPIQSTICYFILFHFFVAERFSDIINISTTLSQSISSSLFLSQIYFF